MWVSTGRTLRVHFKHNVRALVRRWSANTSVDHAASRREREAAPAGEAFPIMAHELGYHSVQVQFNFNRYFGELVFVHEACMSAPRALGACVPSLDTRAGWLDRVGRGHGGDLLAPCHCSDAQLVLNCAGGPPNASK